MKWFSLIGFLLCIPAANWLIGNVGTICIPDGPCLIPVAPGLSAPSGVLMIGLALVLRDVVQQTLGRNWAIGAIATGAGLSWLFASPYLALASGVAFLLAEAADMAVYTPLRNQGRIIAAVFASGVVGSVIDSAVFLWLAFGSFAEALRCRVEIFHHLKSVLKRRGLSTAVGDEEVDVGEGLLLLLPVAADEYKRVPSSYCRLELGVRGEHLVCSLIAVEVRNPE